MQYISYIPVDYRDGRPNGDNSFNCTGNEGYGDERAYDFRLQPISMDGCRSHNKSMIWWIMQKHEATFRLQVQELHRLYGKQRELMEEMKMGKNFLCSRTSELSYSSSSQAFSCMNPSMLPEISSLHGLHQWSRFSEPMTGNALRSAVTCENPVSSSKGNLFNVELLLSGQKGKHSDKRNLVQIVDLQEEKVQADLCNSNERRTGFSIDLNQPIQLDINPPVSSSVVPYDSSETLISEQSGVINSDDSNLVMDFDLNSLPSSSFSGEETTPAMNDSSHKMPVMDSKKSHRISGTILEIDLNSTIPVEDPSELADPTKGTDSMYPISPENQEVSPPRCESEDIGQDLPTDHDLLAARTLVTMLDDNNCLCWFAEIVSSAGDDLKIENELVSGKKRKSAGKHVDHRALGRTEKRCKPQEKPSFSKGGTSSALKQSWGKTGKREGGCKRRRVA